MMILPHQQLPALPRPAARPPAPALCWRRGRAAATAGRAAAAAKPSEPALEDSARSDAPPPGGEADVVVVGAGIGGLSCAATLAYYGLKVVVCESHSVAGGAAHCWSRGGCRFDSGTALFFGLPAAAAGAAGVPGSSLAGALAGSAAEPGSWSQDNPLAAVLLLLGEPLDLIPYGPERTRLVFPEGSFDAQIGSSLFPAVVRQLWGDGARREWLQLQELCRELAAAAVALHPSVVRYDAGVLLTAALRRPARFLSFLAAKPPLLRDHVPFSQVVQSAVRSDGLRSFLDVLCLGTSSVPAAAIPAVYMVRAFRDMYSQETRLQWPRGGPQAIANALVRGLRKHGGRLLLGAHVERLVAGRGGRAAGVQLRSGRRIAARRAVVLNASPWDALRLVPPEAVLPEFAHKVAQMRPSDSFVHLHAVVDLPPGMAPEQLPVHSYFLSPELVGGTGWPTLTIASAVDGSLAPPGKQVLHMYCAEPFAPWEGLARGGAQYQELKGRRAEELWSLVEQVVPGARASLDFQTVGTPLTHARFRRRHAGTYGPAAAGGAGVAPARPEALRPMRGAYCCGDCCFPYVGTPAVAASGMWVASTVASVWRHLAAVEALDGG